MTTIRRCRDGLHYSKRYPEYFADGVITRLTWLDKPNARILIVCNRDDITGYLKAACPKWECIDGVTVEVRQELLSDIANSVIIASDPTMVGEWKFDVIAVLTKEFAIDYYGEFSTDDGILFDFSPYKEDWYGVAEAEAYEPIVLKNRIKCARHYFKALWLRFRMFWLYKDGAKMFASVGLELVFWGLFLFATSSLLRELISFDVALWITLVMAIFFNELRWLKWY